MFLMTSMIDDKQSQKTTARARLLGVSAIAVLAIVGGSALIFLGIRNQPENLASFQTFQGFVYVVLGWGLWRGKRWAWVLLVVVSAVGITNLLLDLVETPPAPEIYIGMAGLALDVLFVWYVTRRVVMDFFGISSMMDEFT